MAQTGDGNSEFSSLGIEAALLEGLRRLKHVTPTPIQKQAIPPAIGGKDVLGIAQTGTGKTLAFGLPILQRIRQERGRALIIVPTRELAMQVEEVLRKVRPKDGPKTAVLIGGAPIGPQRKMLVNNPGIIVGTPGRLIDHLEQRTLKLDSTRIVVLDEADRMLDMGFAPQIKRIFDDVPAERQTLLFSATMPPAIIKMATAYMKLPIRIEIAPSGTPSENVTQEMFVIHRADKPLLLSTLLERREGTALVFTRTRHTAKRLTQSIRTMGHSVAEIHSNRSLGQRRDALEGFKAGRYRVLVATDIASRGIDVEGIALVVNYDLPMNPEDYVHRIGRTARAGAPGHAISFVMPEQRGELQRIERLIKQTLRSSPLPELPTVPFQNLKGPRTHRASERDSRQTEPGKAHRRRSLPGKPSKPRRRHPRGELRLKSERSEKTGPARPSGLTDRQPWWQPAYGRKKGVREGGPAEASNPSRRSGRNDKPSHQGRRNERSDNL